MRTMIAATLMTMALAAPANAQAGRERDPSPNQPQQLTPMQMIEETRRRERQEADRRYEQRAKIPDASSTYDPWRGVRPSAAEKKKQP